MQCLDEQSLFHNVVRMFSSFVTIIFVHFHINIIWSSPAPPATDSIQDRVTVSCDALETWFLCSFKTHSNSSVVCAVQTETNIIQNICSENKVGSAQGKRSIFLLKDPLVWWYPLCLGLSIKGNGTRCSLLVSGNTEYTSQTWECSLSALRVGWAQH